jgi:thiamine biosynthesis lipoprotein
MAIVPLRAASLSVSAVWGKSFTIDGRTYGHVIDPRTGKPVRRAQLAAVVTRSAAESDAFSTALLTLGPAGIDTLAALRPRLGALVVGESVGSRPPRIEARRIELLASSPPGKK